MLLGAHRGFGGSLEALLGGEPGPDVANAQGLTSVGEGLLHVGQRLLQRGAARTGGRHTGRRRGAMSWGPRWPAA